MTNTIKQHDVDVLIKWAEDMGYQVEHDNDGQIVIYTGIFRWADGKHRDEPEEETGQ